MGICECGKPTVWNDMCSDCLEKYEDDMHFTKPYEEETMKSDFYTEKTITVGHCDGWRYVVSIYDDPQNIKIEYQEYDNDSKKWVTKETVHGLWAESARLVGCALIELANTMENK